MYVCNCKGVTDQTIREAAYDGAISVRSIRKCTGATGQCGKCAPHVKSVLSEVLEDINCYDAMTPAYA